MSSKSITSIQIIEQTSGVVNVSDAGGVKDIQLKNEVVKYHR